MARKNKEEYSTIELKKSTKKKLRNLEKYPNETNEEILLRLIKKEITKK